MTVDSSLEDTLHNRILEEALRLTELASSQGLRLRLTGSIAVRLHAPKHMAYLDALGRRRFRDIDFWGYLAEQKRIEQLFEGQGYVADPTIKQAQEWGVKRLIYEHPETRIKIDVFMDELIMAHTIRFKGRLDLDDPTIALADLLLSKLQIHEITANDLIDIIVLLAEHELGPGDRDRIDVDYMVGILRNEWGFSYTALDNLRKTDDALAEYPQLPTEVVSTVRARLAEIRRRTESAPKTARWKLRARLGTRARWYEEVDDVHR
jgi:hypothetical protein